MLLFSSRTQGKLTQEPPNSLPGSGAPRQHWLPGMTRPFPCCDRAPLQKEQAWASQPPCAATCQVPHFTPGSPPLGKHLLGGCLSKQMSLREFKALSWRPHPNCSLSHACLHRDTIIHVYFQTATLPEIVPVLHTLCGCGSSPGFCSHGILHPPGATHCVQSKTGRTDIGEVVAGLS